MKTEALHNRHSSRIEEIEEVIRKANKQLGL
jgi:hypothetical protein